MAAASHSDKASKTFLEMFEKYCPDMMAYAQYKWGDRFEQSAEDIVQEAFLSLWNNPKILESIKEEDQKRLLVTIVKYRTADFFRTEKDQFSIISTDDDQIILDLADTSQSVESIIEEKEIYDILQSALEQLDDTYCSVLELRLIFHLKESEIAKVLNLPESTASVRISRGKKLLQPIFKKYLDVRQSERGITYV